MSTEEVKTLDRFRKVSECFQIMQRSLVFMEISFLMGEAAGLVNARGKFDKAMSELNNILKEMNLYDKESANKLSNQNNDIVKDAQQ